MPFANIPRATTPWYAAAGTERSTETLNGLISIKSNAELGYIPTGTVNDFAGSHKIPKNIKMAIDKIANGEAHKYDIGRIGDRYFSYVAAFGAFTAVAYQTSQTKKASFGKIAYITEAAKSLAELKPYKMTIKQPIPRYRANLYTECFQIPRRSAG